jgi:hypothetical protein
MVGKGNHLMAKTLRKNCLSGDAQKMAGNVENLDKIWDIGHLLQETGKVHGQSLVAHSRVQKIQDSGQRGRQGVLLLNEIYHQKRKNRSKLKLLINDQTIPRIMGKMSHTDWKQWAPSQPK